MRRTLAAAAMLVAVAAAPMTGLSEAFAQAPSLGGLDAPNPPSTDTPAIGAQAHPQAGGPTLPQVKSSASSIALPIGTPMPRMDVPASQLPAPATLPPSETPASQPANVAVPAASSEAPVVSRDEPEIAPAAAPAVGSAETAGETPAAPSEPSAMRDLGGSIPGVTVPNDEPVPERQAPPAALVTPAPAFAVPAPAWISTNPPAETVVERESAAVVEDAAPEVSEPAVPDAPALRGAAVVSLPSSPFTSAFVPPVTATRAAATSGAVSPAPGEEESPIVEDAATANAAAVQATQPGAELPRIRSAAPDPVLDIPALASIEMPGGLHLSLFAALFAALGSAALGLHLLLRRIESTL